MLYQYARVLDTCEPYLIATDAIAWALDDDPLEVEVPEENRFNPQHRKNAEFLGLLRLADALTFGPFGMEMPPWVFYDCAVMPGAVFGLGTRASYLEPWALDAMRVPKGYPGLVPLSAFIAIPMLQGQERQKPNDPPSTWLLYTLHSMNLVSPGMGPEGVLMLTLALGLRVFPVTTLYGTTQWHGPKLGVYTDLGPLEVLSAYTPAHSLPRTLCFRTQIDEARLATLLMGPRMSPFSHPPNVLLDIDDTSKLKEVQREIEAGVHYELVGAPTAHGPYMLAPLRREVRAKEVRP